MLKVKYRTVGLATNVLTAMGMVVRQLPGGEIQPAMKTGLIEALSLTTQLQTHSLVCKTFLSTIT